MITFKAKTPSGEIVHSALSPFQFPAGEAHTKREDRRELERTEIAVIQPSPESLHDDLFQLAMWNKYVMDSEGGSGTRIKRALVLPYMPGARADRGLPFGLGVYAQFISSLELDQIVLFDPHSKATKLSLVNADWTLTIVDSDCLWSVQHQLMDTHVYDGIIAPDKGAHDRAEAVAKVFNIPVFTVDKSRNPDNGKLTINSVPDLDPTKHYLIVDDICDGGGTFMLTAKELEKQIDGFDAQKSLSLYVSHGVFSKGALPDLPFYFNHIITTNSYDPLRELPKGFTRFDIIRTLLKEVK